MLSRLYVALLTVALALGLLTSTPFPQDDFSLYQRFIEALASGSLDLTIPGFHGTDIFGLPIYIVTGSPIAQILGLMIAAVLLPSLGFLAGRALFRDTFSAVVLATAIAMMPFISFVLLRGWTGPGYWVWMLATIILAARRSPWSGVTWGLAMLSKPFAVILLPLILVLFSGEKPHGFFAMIRAWKKQKKADALLPVMIGIGMVMLYVLIQFFQTGTIFVGAHGDLSPASAIQGPVRILLNLAHSLQILFSVHNYYFPDPALTGPGNMMHTSPLLIFLGLFALLSPAKYFKDLRLPKALFIGAIAGIFLNALLDHMDHFYMEASILMFIIAAVPVLKNHRLWIPLVIATLHFQWFYFWLQYREGFALQWTFWLVPVVVDACFLMWSLSSLAKRRAA